MNQYHLLACIAGIVLPLQIAFNNKLTNFSLNPVTSSLISFSVGTISLLIYSLSQFNSFQKSLQQVHQAPTHAWLGGLLGAFYIISTIIASPKIGIALFLALVIGGQLLMSLTIDNFGWFGVEVKQFTWIKGAGMLCILLGIVLLKK
jgi:transporter family-2 protein